jgi:hypothetical protein
MIETRNTIGWTKRFGSTLSLSPNTSSVTIIASSIKSFQNVLDVLKKNGESSSTKMNQRTQSFPTSRKRLLLIKISVTSFTSAWSVQFVRTELCLHATSSSRKYLEITSLNQLLIKSSKYGKSHYPTDQFYIYCPLALIPPITLTSLLRRRSNSQQTKYLWAKSKRSQQSTP